jgi:polyphosphate kinase
VLQNRLVDGLLGVVLSDNTKARMLQSDGTYHRIDPRSGDPPIRSQVEFQNMARELSSTTPMRPSPGPGFKVAKDTTR